MKWVSIIIPEDNAERLELENSRTVDWSLTTQLLKHFGSTSEAITGLANGDVENEFVNSQLAHSVGALVFAFRHLVEELTIETEL